jgi:hypothetical protein
MRPATNVRRVADPDPFGVDSLSFELREALAVPPFPGQKQLDAVGGGS